MSSKFQVEKQEAQKFWPLVYLSGIKEQGRPCLDRLLEVGVAKTMVVRFDVPHPDRRMCM